ncbi:MAG: TIGR03915 family putative DNA repair protein [Ferruginibacter sp.]
MTIVVYDGSFAGLLTAIFEVYEYKIQEASISKTELVSGSLFGIMHNVITNTDKSQRVLKKLEQRISPRALQQLYHAYLSEIKDVENLLLRYIQYSLKSDPAMESNYGDDDVLLVQQISKKISREKHRMEAFVRFQLTKDELYYSIIQPDYNVLPLISKHFEDRYADQRWLIYDAFRKYGLYYNGENVEEVQMQFAADLSNAQSMRNIFDDREELFQQLWKLYFNSVNIAARKNLKLHIQHMPKRYWRYLIEKQ